MKLNVKFSRVLVAFLLSVIIAVPCIAFTCSADTVSLYGDANSDNSFDIRDLVCLKKYCSNSHNTINLSAVHVSSAFATDFVIMLKALIGVQPYTQYFTTEEYFLNFYNDLLQKSTSDVTDKDIDFINKALNSWQNLSNEAKNATNSKKQLLDDLLSAAQTASSSSDSGIITGDGSSGDYFPGNW